MTIAFFDFDGTITSKDSFTDFFRFIFSKKKFYLGFFRMSPIIIAYKLKLMSNSRAKEKVMTHFFRGWKEEDFDKAALDYQKKRIDDIVKASAMERIEWHKEQGHRVVIVSASFDKWLKNWTEKLEVDLISTRLEVEDGILSGRFETPNCHGSEKVKRIKEQYDLSRYDKIYAYGDSSGDKDMLALADEKFYRFFK